MKTQIASIELYALVSELQILVNGKVDKIYQPQKEELIIQFHVPGLGKKMLRVLAGKLLYLTDFKPVGGKPHGFLMQLRKNLANARLRRLEQRGFERVVELVFEHGKDEFISLIIELFGQGNILLVKNNTILMTLFPKIWKDRTLKVGEGYVYPQRDYNLLDFKEGDLKVLFEETDKESVVKALAMDLGLGGIYAEDICSEAGVNKDKSPGEVKKVEQLFKAIERLKKQKPKGFVYKKNIVPYELLQYKSLEHKEFSSYNEALNSVLATEVREAIGSKETKAYDKEVARVHVIVKSQKNTLVKLAKTEKEAREKAELIYSKYSVVKDVLDEINKAVEKVGWDAVKEKLKGHDIVKEINAKEKTVVVEL